MNQEEIHKFTKIADQWWNQNGAFKFLHVINNLRLSFILEQRQSLEGLSILDVGCGGGILCEALAKLGAKVTGIDAGLENIEQAQKHALTQALNINYQTIALENFTPPSNEKFDLVISFEVIEHCDDHIEFLNKLCSLVKNDGLLFLSTINRNSKSYLMAIIAAEYILRWLPRHTHEWSKFLKPHEINQVLQKNNFTTEIMKGMEFDICKQKWKLTNNLNVNYLMCAKFLTCNETTS